MRFIKCDKCKKTIKNKPVTIGIGIFPSAELCEKCGEFAVEFLRRNKLIEQKSVKSI